jgi:hypothetical protein
MYGLDKEFPHVNGISSIGVTRIAVLCSNAHEGRFRVSVLQIKSDGHSVMW